MGTATIEVTSALRERLETDTLLHDEIRILSHTVTGDGYWWLRVSSPLLKAGENGMQEIVINGSSVRFKNAVDHDIGAGRPT